ncbi:MAG: hypothetical protein ACRECY_07195 [Phyllobacterium sp.]
MTSSKNTPKPREGRLADQLASQYRAIGPAAIRAAVLRSVRQRPLLKFPSIVQETD